MTKITTVKAQHAMSVGQKPQDGYTKGNTRNIGSVGTTYQNVYHAWLAIFCALCPSNFIQINTNTVTNGKAAIKPPKRSLRLATSEINTTIAAVSAYLEISQSMENSFQAKIKGKTHLAASTCFIKTWRLPLMIRFFSEP